MLDPTRRRQPPEPTDRPIRQKRKNKPTPSTETIQYYIQTSDVAKILHHNANLRDNLTALRAILEMNSEACTKKISEPTFIEICSQKSFQENLCTIEDFLQAWSRSEGIVGATVCVLYDKYKEHGHDGIIGKLRKPSRMSGELYRQMFKQFIPFQTNCSAILALREIPSLVTFRPVNNSG
jgi:hypothetical protein